MNVYCHGKEVSEEKRKKLQQLIKQKMSSDNPAGLSISDQIYFILNPGSNDINGHGSTTDISGHEAVVIKIELAKGEAEIKATIVETLIRNNLQLKKGMVPSIIITRACL